MTLQVDKFTLWAKFDSRAQLSGMNYPGIYAIAVSEQSLDGKPFSLLPEIKYFGMTNSKGGLRSRLNQFAGVLIGKKGHGGAERFTFKYRNNLEWLQRHLFVSVRSFECNTQACTPYDLLTMGEVAKAEYVAFSAYSEAYGSLPLFNNKSASPKN